MRFSRFLALTLFLIFGLLSTPSHAGQVIVHDNTGTFSGGDIANFRALAVEWPFDTVVYLDTSAGSQGAFLRTVDGLSRFPHTVAIGVDPTHHYTSVYVSSDIVVQHSDLPGLYRAGDRFFLAGDIRGGIVATAEHANGVVQVRPTLPSQAQPDTPWPTDNIHNHARERSSLGFFGCLCVIGGLIAVAIIAYIAFKQDGRVDTALSVDRRRNRRLPEYPKELLPTKKYVDGGLSMRIGPASDNPFTRAGVAPTYVQVATGSPNPPPSSVDPLLAGVVGYELGKMTATPVLPPPPTPATITESRRHPLEMMTRFSQPEGRTDDEPSPSGTGGGATWSVPASDPTPEPQSSYGSSPPPSPRADSSPGLGGGTTWSYPTPEYSSPTPSESASMGGGSVWSDVLGSDLGGSVGGGGTWGGDS